MNEATSALQVFTLESRWGWLAAAGSHRTLRFLTIGHPHEAAALEAVRRGPLPDWPELAPWHPRLAKMLAGYLQGKPIDFREIDIDQSHLTPFQLGVVKACRKIPAGETRSYGELALLVGSPGAARAVGSVMAKNRYPLIVPCHRVIASSGQLGGFSAPQGLPLKRRLLELEGAQHAVHVG